MSVFADHELDAIEEGFVESLGGKNSQLRETITATLGHPERPREVYVPQSVREYVGQVWVHDVVGDLPIGDTEDTPRDDSPSGYFTAYLPPENILSGRRKPGTSVYLKWIKGRWQVEGVAGVAAENYLENVPEIDYISIQRNQLQWGLIIPDEPPSGRVRLAGLRWPFDGEWRNIPDQFSIDLIAGYAAGLTPGQGKAVQIEVDPTDNTIVYTAGSAFTDTSLDLETGAVNHPEVFSHYPKGTNSDLLHYGWVKLYHNMLEISEQDIYIAPDTGGGAGVTDAADLTYTPADATDWNGSADPGDTNDALDQLADRVNTLEGAGGGGGISDGYRLRGSGDTCGASTSTKLTFSEIYDTNGYYNAGTNVQTPSVGHWTHMAYVALALNDDATAFGYISAYITGEYADELPITQTQLTVFTMSGVTVDYILAFPICAGGNVDTPNEFELWIDNFSGQDATVQDCWIEGLRTGDQLTTP